MSFKLTRIEKVVNWEVFYWFTFKFSELILKEMYGYQKGELIFRAWSVLKLKPVKTGLTGFVLALVNENGRHCSPEPIKSFVVFSDQSNHIASFKDNTRFFKSVWFKPQTKHFDLPSRVVLVCCWKLSRKLWRWFVLCRMMKNSKRMCLPWTDFQTGKRGGRVTDLTQMLVQKYVAFNRQITEKARTLTYQTLQPFSWADESAENAREKNATWRISRPIR